MQTLVLSGNIASVDAPVGAAINTVDVDCREVVGESGFFSFQAAASAVGAGSVSVAAQITSENVEGSDTVLNIDFRETPGCGGFITATVANTLIEYDGAAAPTAPTVGTAVSGSQAARNETFAVTYVDADGNESLASPTTAEAIPANDVAHVTSPGASTGAVNYNVYGCITSGTPTLQNSTPIALGTPWQELAGGLTTTGRGVPTENAFSDGACTVTVSQGGAFADGACTLTVTQ